MDCGTGVATCLLAKTRESNHFTIPHSAHGKTAIFCIFTVLYIGWSDSTFFAIFEIGHIADDQVYF